MEDEVSKKDTPPENPEPVIPFDPEHAPHWIVVEVAVKHWPFDPLPSLDKVSVAEE